MQYRLIQALEAITLFLLFLWGAGCSTQGNHITLVEVPSGQVAGMATERGVLVLKKPAIKIGDLYPIQHVYGNGVVHDEARVEETDEYLALLTPLSSQLNNVRFLASPIEPEEALYIGILDENNEDLYLHAEMYQAGMMGDFVMCEELINYPEPSQDGYAGVGLFAERHGYLYLAGLLTPMTLDKPGLGAEIYAFLGIDQIYRFLPDLDNRFKQEQKPFRPDFIHGVERDGSGE
jgi:hypothetical protein